MNWQRALGGLLLVTTLSACVAGIGGPRGGSPSASPPSVEPSGPSGSGSSPGSDTPVQGPSLQPVPSGSIPIFPGEPQLLVPHPGHVNLRPVSVVRLDVPAGRRGVVRASWWSGIEPCTGLDSVLISRKARSISITVREGTPADAGNIACIDIAVFKATIIDLGNLAKGTYSVRTTDGGAKPVNVTID